MGIAQTISRWGAALLIERPVRKRSIDDLITQLNTAAEGVGARFDQASQSDKNHAQATHIIGIERWSQLRLRCALGEDFTDDEYDSYRPPRDTAWEDLPALFRESRAETIRIAESIRDSGDSDALIAHNQYAADSRARTVHAR